MFDDPDFAYNVIRPIAVIGGWLFSIRLGWALRGWLDSRAARRKPSMRNITPGEGRMRALLFALLVAACASPNGEGRSTDWARNSFTDAADLGNGQWLITCQTTASACTARARAICGEYEVVDAGTMQSVSGAAGAYGGGFGTRTDYRMTVRCS